MDYIYPWGNDLSERGANAALARGPTGVCVFFPEVFASHDFEGLGTSREPSLTACICQLELLQKPRTRCRETGARKSYSQRSWRKRESTAPVCTGATGPRQDYLVYLFMAPGA